MMLKKLTQKNIILLILGVILMAACIFVLTRKIWLVHNTSIGQNVLAITPIIDSSTITYDAKTTIPNTGVTFAYPKQGYYGMGAKIETAQHFGTFFEGIECYTLISTAPEGEQQVSVAVYNMGEVKTLDDAISLYRSNMDDTDRSVTYTKIINGVHYFLKPPVYKNDNTYRAIRVANEHILEVTFEGGFDVKSKDVPAVITQFLTKLDSTCSTDCSDNSAPVINMDKYRFGNTE